MSPSTRRVHDDLVAALDRLRRAEHSAVILFARVMREGLFRDLGHASIELYGTESLGLSPAKVHQFIALARALEDLPATREALDRGTLSWTKARTVARVASPRTEDAWVRAAARSTSRELEEKVARARQRGRRERDRLREKRGQAALVLDTPSETPTTPEVPTSITLTMSPVERARCEALMERLRRDGRRESRTELFLAGLEALASGDGTRDSASSPYRIVAYRCDTCNTTTVGSRPASRAAAAAMTCDHVAVSQDPAIPNRSSIPPATRRAVLARDGPRCTAPGCGATSFLEVHHVVPRASGGGNGMENLRTLCGRCHRFVHERGEPEVRAVITG